MVIGGVNLVNVFCAPGARNFDGNGYWHSRYSNWTGSTFVAKTTTVEPRMDPEKGRGNMRLNPRTLQPVDFLPSCIKVYPRSQSTLNSVGLSGPGLKDLLDRGFWQTWEKPFMISVAPESKEPADIITELGIFSRMLLKELPRFLSPVVVILNVTCPNIGHGQKNIITEGLAGLEALSPLRLPIFLNLNVLVDPSVAYMFSQNPVCRGLFLTNSIPFGRMPERIPWEKLFGKTSPLQKFGGGGLSGPMLLPIVEDWLINFRKNYSPFFPVIAGGGVFSPEDGLRLCKAGASGIFIGTMSMHRPWRVQPTIQAVNDYFRR